jgi:hypothetical protein
MQSEWKTIALTAVFTFLVVIALGQFYIWAVSL